MGEPLESKEHPYSMFVAQLRRYRYNLAIGGTMIRLTLVLVAALTVLSCGDNGDSKLCEGVTCSDHGTCKIENDQAVCYCETDFVANGLECVHVNCEGVTCSDHGTCKVENDQAVCDCETGFFANALECVPETTVESFTDGAEPDPCTANIPICQTVVGCSLSEKKYYEGQFPGYVSIAIVTPADATIVVKMFFETRIHPGQDTEINWYEPGCQHSYSYQSTGADIFDIAGEDRVFTQEQKIIIAGDHLVEINSDASTHYYLRIEIH